MCEFAVTALTVLLVRAEGVPKVTDPVLVISEKFIPFPADTLVTVPVVNPVAAIVIVEPLSVMAILEPPDKVTFAEPDVLLCISDVFAPPAATDRLPSFDTELSM